MKALRDENGQTVVVFALFMGLLAMGFLAFALDVGSLFRQKRLAQSAADAVAVVAASEVGAGNAITSSDVTNAAAAVAKLNGLDTTLTTNPTTIKLSVPTTGNFTGSAYVQAIVTVPVHTIFLGAFSRGLSVVPVAATAIGGGGSTSQTCVCLEGTTGQDLNMSNGSSVTATGCGIVADSSSSNAVGVVGGSTLSGQSLGMVSSTWTAANNVNNGGSINSSMVIVTGISSTCAPTMPAVPAYGTCAADPGGSYVSFTAGPANASGTVCYTGLTIGANGSLETLNPGIYVIKNGNLHFESGSGGKSNLGGNGVFFYLLGTATLTIDNGANVNLVAGGNTQSNGTIAPTIGTYNGIVIYQDSADTGTVSLQGGSTSYLNGAIYAPSAPMTIGNGSGASLIGGIVASTLTMNGGGTLTANAATNEGSLTTGSSPKLVQ